MAADSAQRQRAAITELAVLRHLRERHWQADLTDEETVEVVSAALRTPTTRTGPGGAITILARADDELALWLHPFGT